jgi:L-ascorbate metabolism protein UlaG (beta-lactamase superfamily)
LVLDPLDDSSGLKIPGISADIILQDGGSKESAKSVKGKMAGEGGRKDPFLISGPGEYEIRNIFIQGIISNVNNGSVSKEKNTIYVLEAEEMRICHLGRLSQKELNSEQIEEIGNVDILMVPVGGGKYLDAKSASKVIGQVEPRIVIPMLFKLPKIKEKLDGLEDFLKVMGQKAVQPQPKLLIKARDLSEEGPKVAVLKP